MIEELNQIRKETILDRHKFRTELKLELKKHGKLIGDLAEEVAKKCGKTNSNVYSRISSGYINDELWVHIVEYLEGLQ